MARDPDKYLIDGRRVPSVTEILSLAGIVDLSHLDPGMLVLAAERGTYVHEACEFLDRGDSLAFVESIDPERAGYVRAYARFKEESGFVPELIEHAVKHPTHRYCGTLDRTGTLNKNLVIIDIKSGPIMPSVAIQLAGYELCLDRRHRRFALGLRNDGTYILREFRDKRDTQVFLAAVAIAHWKKEQSNGTH